MSGGGDKTVRLWDPQTGKLIRTLEGHTDVVRSVNFSPDQKTLVASINAFINDLPKADSHVTAVSAPQSDEGKLARSVHDIVDTPAKRHPNNEERLQNLRSIYSELSLGALPKRP